MGLGMGFRAPGGALGLEGRLRQEGRMCRCNRIVLLWKVDDTTSMTSTCSGKWEAKSLK